MPEKYMCLRECFQRNEVGKWKLFRVGETEWRDQDPGKHWSKMPTGEPKTAVEIMQIKCKEIGIEPDKDWDIARLQREYDHRMAQNYAQQDKRVMAKTVGQADNDYTGKVELPKKGK